MSGDVVSDAGSAAGSCDQVEAELVRLEMGRGRGGGEDFAEPRNLRPVCANADFWQKGLILAFL